MRIGNEYAAKTLCKAVQACYNFSVYTEDGTNETTGRSCMENKLIRSKYFLYLTEFFAGMSVMAVELGASRLMAPYFSSSQIVWTVIIGVIMIAMAIGNVWGGKLADRSATPDKLYRRLIIAAIWIALIPFVGRYLIAGISLVLNALVYLGLDGILWVLRVPGELKPLMKEYLVIIFLGITATFLYNYFANLLRAIGNSVVPLVFLAVSAVLNVILDLVCVLVLQWGVKGAAGATVFSQFVSGIGIGLYTLKKFPQLCPKKADCRWDKKNLDTILNLSVMTSVQQSIMNFGILMVQGLVNSFGTVIMAAFAAAVKIDSFAYMPVQDFGNAFSTYVAQNYGAGETDRIKKGIRSAGLCSAVFCVCISVLVCAFAAPLMGIFIDPGESAIIAAGVHYLRIEDACYIGIGILFLLYGYYRAVNQPQMSVVLTIASLGTRVALAYLLSATPLGVTGIWLSVPIGWALADAIGIGYYLKKKR